METCGAENRLPDLGAPMRQLSGTLRAGINPSLNQLAGQILSAWRGVAAGSRVPAPSDQIVLRHMRLQQREVAPAIAVTILHLPADIADRFAFPRHLDRPQQDSTAAILDQEPKVTTSAQPRAGPSLTFQSP